MTWDPAASALVGLLPRTGRGPRREGIFALWLTLRVAQDLLRDPPPTERAHRRRLQALEHRLSSLTLPPPLRRALTAALSQLREGRPETAAQPRVWMPFTRRQLLQATLLLPAGAAPCDDGTWPGWSDWSMDLDKLRPARP